MSGDLISMTPLILHHFFLRERRKAKGNVVNVMETLYLHFLSSQTNSLLRMLQRDVLGRIFKIHWSYFLVTVFFTGKWLKKAFTLIFRLLECIVISFVLLFYSWHNINNSTICFGLKTVTRNGDDRVTPKNT